MKPRTNKKSIESALKALALRIERRTTETASELADIEKRLGARIDEIEQPTMFRAAPPTPVDRVVGLVGIPDTAPTPPAGLETARWVHIPDEEYARLVAAEDKLRALLSAIKRGPDSAGVIGTLALIVHQDLGPRRPMAASPDGTVERGERGGVK